MGGQQSVPTSPLLKTPWRKIEWSENERVLQFVKNYKPRARGQQLRILLYGPLGAGKSSFINSVQSAMHGRICVHALTDNIMCRSFTQTYKTYKIREESRDSFYPFVFNDVMGLDQKGGVLVEDISLVLKGHVRDGYKFNPELKLSEDNPFYNKSPTSMDRVHVLVCVVPFSTISDVDTSIFKKIQDIRMEASELGIPQVAIFTKIDDATSSINENLQNVYQDKNLMNKMEQFSVEVGIPLDCIFPVKNYHSEICVDSDVDALILNTLENLIKLGDSSINFNKSLERLIFFNTHSVALS